VSIPSNTLRTKTLSVVVEYTTLNTRTQARAYLSVNLLLHI